MCHCTVRTAHRNRVVDGIPQYPPVPIHSTARRYNQRLLKVLNLETSILSNGPLECSSQSPIGCVFPTDASWIVFLDGSENVEPSSHS